LGKMVIGYMNKSMIDKIRIKLKSSSVGIAGIGGLGSNAAIALTRAGVGRLVLVDFDFVEKNNLDRQYFFLDQVGKLKTTAIKENIKKINPETIVETHEIKLEKGTMENPFRNVDVIIEALDSAEIKTSFIEEILEKLPDKPIIAASGITGYGHCERFHTKCLGNLYMCYDEEAKSSDEDILFAPRVAIAANWEANLALELLLEKDQ
jgi:sulfur carrier protein ThiS adenylyltransferase